MPAAGLPDSATELPDAAQETATATAAGASSWFRAKRPSLRSPRDTGHPPDTGYASAARNNGDQRHTGHASAPRHAAADGGWADGWRIAETLSPPVPGDQTSAGLPTRVPGANLFHRPPGGGPLADRRAPGQRAADAGTEPLMPPRPAPPQRRSPERARTRLSGFQLGSREAEAGAPSAGEGASR